MEIREIIEQNRDQLQNSNEIKEHLRLIETLLSTKRKDITPNNYNNFEVKNNAIINCSSAPLALKSQKFTPNFYSGFYDGMVVLFGQDGEAKTGIKAHSKLIWCIEELKGSNNFATSSEDKNIRIWDLETSKMINTMTNRQVINCIKSFDENTLISCGDDGNILFWDMRQKNKVKQYSGHTSMVSWCEIINENVLASCSADESVIIWDLKTDKKIKKLEGHTNAVRRLCKLDENSMASCGYDSTVIIWDLNGENTTIKHKIKPFEKCEDLHSICPIFSDEYSFLLIGGANGLVGVSDFEGNMITSIVSSEHAINFVEVLGTFPPKIVSACEDKVINVWDIVI